MFGVLCSVGLDMVWLDSECGVEFSVLCFLVCGTVMEVKVVKRRVRYSQSITLSLFSRVVCLFFLAVRPKKLFIITISL